MYMCALTGMYILHSALPFYTTAVIKAQYKAGPEGEEPPTREEEEGEKMQANPCYLPIEMNYKSQEQQYVNVKMANPSYLPIEINYKSQESKYINIPT